MNDLEQRVWLLEETVANLRDELDGYKALFAAAAQNPAAKQVLRLLGVNPGAIT